MTNVRKLIGGLVKRFLTRHVMTAIDIIKLQRARQRLIGSLRERLDGALIAIPTTLVTAPEIGNLKGNDDLFYGTNLKLLRNTVRASFLTTPGVALSNGNDKNKMSTSFLIFVENNRNDFLLSAACLIESEISD